MPAGGDGVVRQGALAPSAPNVTTSAWLRPSPGQCAAHRIHLRRHAPCKFPLCSGYGTVWGWCLPVELAIPRFSQEARRGAGGFLTQQRGDVMSILICKPLHVLNIVLLGRSANGKFV